MLMLSDLKKREDSFLDRMISEHEDKCNKNKTGGEKFGNPNIGNTKLVVLNNYHLFLDSKSELISFGRVF